MDRDDIRRNIEVGKDHSKCVSIQLAADYPGYVRSIYVRQGNRVSIEYEVHGMDEGGVYYEGVYLSLDAGLDAIEKFVGRPVEEWENMDYPEWPDGVILERGHAALKEAIRTGSVPLPSAAKFVLTNSSYWKQFELE